MNKAILIGRLTKDPELRYSKGKSSLAIAKFNIAINKKYKEGNQSADFINCTSFGKTAEFVERYFKQGMKMALVGRIQTGSYIDQEGRKVYTTEVIVEEVEFVESKKQESNKNQEDEFMQIPDDDDLPFN